MLDNIIIIRIKIGIQVEKCQITIWIKIGIQDEKCQITIWIKIGIQDEKCQKTIWIQIISYLHWIPVLPRQPCKYDNILFVV